VSAPGAGGSGHAATLEAVQTTRDLRGVVLDASSRPWAIGSQARLMQRRKDVWMRIPLDPMVRASLVVGSVREDFVTVVAEDGSVYEAPLPAGSAWA
jgi:hypothetical protein